MPTQFGEETVIEYVLRTNDIQRADPYIYELLTRRYPVHTIALQAGPFPERAWVFYLDPARHASYANTRDREGRQRCTNHHQSYAWSYLCGLSACYQFHDRHADIIPAYLRLVHHFKSTLINFRPHAEVMAALMTYDL